MRYEDLWSLNRDDLEAFVEAWERLAREQKVSPAELWDRHQIDPADYPAASERRAANDLIDLFFDALAERAREES